MNYLLVSNLLGEMFTLLRVIIGLELFRYRLIVANSDRGVDCPYAKICLRTSEEANEITTVLGIIDRITDIGDQIRKELTMVDTRGQLGADFK